MSSSSDSESEHSDSSTSEQTSRSNDISEDEKPQAPDIHLQDPLLSGDVRLVETGVDYGERTDEEDEPTPNRANKALASKKTSEIEGKSLAERSKAAASLVKKKPSSKKKAYRPGACLNLCKYPIIHECAEKMGFRIVNDDEEYTLFWADCSVSNERIAKFTKYHRHNHFPGMSEISRKDTLGRNLNRMLRAFPDEFSFFPRTWNLPQDYLDFKATFKGKGKKKTFIVKPEASSQGKGIYLSRNPDEITGDTHGVAQQYLHKPYLIDGYKFDMRIYVLVLSCDPLKVFLFKDGLARFCTEKYVEPNSKNIHRSFMHLTNYAINKFNDDFEYNEAADKQDVGSKRSISAIRKHLEEQGIEWEPLWDEIADIVVKTLIAVQPSLAHQYHACFPDDVEGNVCFEILGFDIFLDRKLRPWLIEVNHAPSFTCDSPLDTYIKEAVVSGTFQLLGISSNDRKKRIAQEKARLQSRLYGRAKLDDKEKEAEARRRKEAADIRIAWENENCGNFIRIFPTPDRNERFEKVLGQPTALLSETASSLARRQMILQRKKQQEDEKEKEKQQRMRAVQKRREQRQQQLKEEAERKAQLELATGDERISDSQSAERDKENNSEQPSASEMGDEEAGNLYKVNTIAYPTIWGYISLIEGDEIVEEEERLRNRERLMRDHLVKYTGLRERVADLLLGINEASVSAMKKLSVNNFPHGRHPTIGPAGTHNHQGGVSATGNAGGTQTGHHRPGAAAGGNNGSSIGSGGRPPIAGARDSANSAMGLTAMLESMMPNEGYRSLRPVGAGILSATSFRAPSAAAAHHPTSTGASTASNGAPMGVSTHQMSNSGGSGGGSSSNSSNTPGAGVGYAARNPPINPPIQGGLASNRRAAQQQYRRMVTSNSSVMLGQNNMITAGGGASNLAMEDGSRQPGNLGRTLRIKSVTRKPGGARGAAPGGGNFQLPPSHSSDVASTSGSRPYTSFALPPNANLRK
jgi:tubulin polyglutamylase TTLL6/13